MSLPLLTPDWPAPVNVRCAVTTRQGGVSKGPWHSLNVGDHVDDHPDDVRVNRERVQQQLQIGIPHWLKQVHGVGVHYANTDFMSPITADAAWTDQPHQVCAVMTADCLPVLFCDRDGTCVAASHAGWRGLLDGVLEATMDRMPVKPASLLVWLGPAISARHFEVGEEVRAAFMQQNSANHEAFTPGLQPGKWMADIYVLARIRLHALGVKAIFGGDLCTYSDAERFHSYRRDGVQSGRMVSLIWINNPA